MPYSLNENHEHKENTTQKTVHIGSFALSTKPSKVKLMFMHLQSCHFSYFSVMFITVHTVGSVQFIVILKGIFV